MSDATASEKLTWRSRRLRARVLFSAFLVAFACYAFFTWIMWPVKILGDSMLPNFRDGERHFINKLAYRSTDPQRGDVVGLYAPNGDVYIKRVTALPGETITFTNGGIAIDGQFLNEPYAVTRIPLRSTQEGKIPPGHFFVIGDNRATSVFGAVPKEDIIGKVVF